MAKARRRKDEEDEAETREVHGVAGDRLRSFIERIERLEEEKRETAEAIKEVLAEAKGNGYDVKTIRQVLKLRRMDKDDVDEAEALLDTYLRAIGMRSGRGEAA